MARCDMQGFATKGELYDRYFELSMMTKEQRKEKKFALFVIGKGMLDGEEAYNYLKEKMENGY